MVLAIRLILLAWLALLVYIVHRAMTGRPRLYWLAAALLYGLSALFAWSIGRLLVAGVFALVGVGLAHAVARTPPPLLVAGSTAAGLLVWAGWLLLGDITWSFWPLLAPLEWLFSG